MCGAGNMISCTGMNCYRCKDCGWGCCAGLECLCDLIKATKLFLTNSALWGDEGEHRALLYDWLERFDETL